MTAGDVKTYHRGNFYHGLQIAAVRNSRALLQKYKQNGNIEMKRRATQDQLKRSVSIM